MGSFVVPAALAALAVTALAFAPLPAIADEARVGPGPGVHDRSQRVVRTDRIVRPVSRVRHSVPPRRVVHFQQPAGYAFPVYGYYPRREILVAPPPVVPVSVVRTTTIIVTHPPLPLVAGFWDEGRPYMRVYDTTPGPIYNKPCLC